MALATNPQGDAESLNLLTPTTAFPRLIEATTFRGVGLTLKSSRRMEDDRSPTKTRSGVKWCMERASDGSLRKEVDRPWV